MRIRQAQEQDAPAIAAGEWSTAATPGRLVGRPGEIPLSAFSEKVAALAARGSYWVAQEDDAVVAHCFLEPMKMTGNAHVFQLNIVVHPGFLGQGLGTALMTTMLTWAEQQPDLEKIELLVRATNSRAVALYQKFGFLQEGRLKRRVRTADNQFIDDLLMAWTPKRKPREQDGETP